MTLHVIWKKTFCVCPPCRNYAAPMSSSSSLFSWSSSLSSPSSKCQRPRAGLLKTSPGALKDEEETLPLHPRRLRWWRWIKQPSKIVTHLFFHSFMLKESLKEWAKKTMRTGTFFPSSIAAIFFSPTCSPILPGLPALSKSDMGDLPYWEEPGTCKNNFIFPATNIRRTEKSWQYFYFSHVKLPFGVNILMHTVTIMCLNLITIFVVSWSDLLNKSPALWVYSVRVCMVLHWNLASLPKSHLAFFLSSVHFFLASGKKGTKSHAYFSCSFIFCIDRLKVYFYFSLFICMSLCKYLFF